MTDDEVFSGGDDAKADLSPMIDLVFLLLIFFIVTAQIVQYKKDPKVEISAAAKAKVSDNTKDRLVINLYQDGTIKDVNGKVLSLSELTTLCRTEKSKEPKTKFLLRADRRAQYAEYEKVSKAAAAGGMSKIIYATEN